MGIQDFLDSCENSVELHDSFTVSWSISGVGFGQYRFYIDDGKVHIDNETMSRASIKHVLNMMVDNAILDDDLSRPTQCLNEFTPRESLFVEVPDEYNHPVEFVSTMELLNIPFVKLCTTWDDFKYVAKLNDLLVIVTDDENPIIIGWLKHPESVNLHDLADKNEQ